MSFLFPKPPEPLPPPKAPMPDEGMAQADRQASLLRRRRGRASTILSDETLGESTAQPQTKPFKSLLGQ